MLKLASFNDRDTVKRLVKSMNAFFLSFRSSAPLARGISVNTYESESVSTSVKLNESKYI